jgi:hypothetical protein
MSDQEEAGCPPLAELIRATEGAMPPEEASVILTHLESCGWCREELRQTDALTEAAASCLDEEFGEDKLPRCARFRQTLDVNAQMPPHLLTRVVRLPGVRWLSAAAVGPLLLSGLMFFNASTVVVQADALLERVVLESHAQPAGLTQQVQVTVTPAAGQPVTWSRRRGTKRPDPPALAVGSFTVVRNVVDGIAVPDGSPAYAAAVEPPPALKRLLDLQPVDWQRPLCVEGLRQWRRALTTKRDEILTEDDHLLVLRTTTTEGLLREVSLVVRRDTYRVIRQLLVFEGIGRVEIEELTQWVRQTAPAPGSIARLDANGNSMTAESGDASAAHDKVERDRLDRAEIDARIMLREAGLDLGGLIRISRASDSVRVDGVVLTDVQRRDVGERLSALPGVRVALRVRDAAAVADAAANAGAGLGAGSGSGVSAGAGADVSAGAGGGRGAAADGVQTPGSGASGTRQPALSRWLAHTFAEGTTARARFVPELTRLISIVGQRLAALQDLADRYQTADVRALAPDARARLQLLVNMHYDGLNRDLLALDSRMAVLFGSTERCLQTPSAPSDWPHRAVTGLTHARTLDRQVQELLSHEDLPALDTTSDGHTHINRTFGALWDSVNAKPASRNLLARGPSPST